MASKSTTQRQAEAVSGLAAMTGVADRAAAQFADTSIIVEIVGSGVAADATVGAICVAGGFFTASVIGLINM